MSEVKHFIIGPGMTPPEIRLRFVMAVSEAMMSGHKMVLNFNPGSYLVSPDDIPHIEVGKFRHLDALFLITGPGGGSIEVEMGNARPIITFHDIRISDKPP